jgi:protocatechuate 3,4-dioxygenase beta subunit
MLRSLCLAVFLIVTAVNVYSQSALERASITGVVLDQTGAAIAGAKVQLSVGDISQQSTTTDQSGGFRFTRVAPAKYQIQVVTIAAQPPRRLQMSFRLEF